MDVSVRAAAAGIIAADFYAVPTDSVLPLKIRQRLWAARQQSDSRLTCCFSRWRRPYAENDIFQFLSHVSILLLTRDIDIVILSVRLSVCLSVTRWYCMKTA